MGDVMQILYILLLVIIDHITKYIAKIQLSYGKSVTLIDGFLELIYVENRGAAFGILKNKNFSCRNNYNCYYRNDLLFS